MKRSDTAPDYNCSPEPEEPFLENEIPRVEQHDSNQLGKYATVMVLCRDENGKVHFINGQI